MKTGSPRRALALEQVLQQQVERQLEGEGEQRQLHQLALGLPLPPEQGRQYGVERAITGTGDEPADPGLWPVVGVQQADTAHLQVPLLDLVHNPSFPEVLEQTRATG